MSKTFQRMINNVVFNIPDGLKIIAMSDIHSATDYVVSDMVKKGIIDKYVVVLSCGDMAGNSTKLGTNVDPYQSYLSIRNAAKAFYFVQGNHDIYSDQSQQLCNDDGTRCCVDQLVQNTVIGKIGGVSGIEAKKEPEPNRHIYDSLVYTRRFNKMIRCSPDILMTHQHYPLASTDMGISNIHIHLCGH